MDNISLVDYQAAAAKAVRIPGLWLEFGVWKGASAEQLLKQAPDVLYGFDTFTGLPEDWRADFPAGRFSTAGEQPKIDRLICIAGLIQDTLPPFLMEHTEPCALVHIDTDLYSAAEFILRTLREAGRLVEGTIIMFDEIAEHPGWQDDEWKAATEQLFPYFRCIPAAARVKFKRDRPGFDDNIKCAYRLYTCKS